MKWQRFNNQRELNAAFTTFAKGIEKGWTDCCPAMYDWKHRDCGPIPTIKPQFPLIAKFHSEFVDGGLAGDHRLFFVETMSKKEENQLRKLFS